jgi:hypothetical protein
VREAAIAPTPTDREALAAGAEAGHSAVVEVSWSDTGHRLATLRVYLASQNRWMDRAIGFGAADADAERGRTVGFALASMLPPEAATAAPPSIAVPPSPPPSPPPAPPPPAARPEPDAANAAPSSRGASGIAYSLDLVGVAAASASGDTLSGGGGAAVDTYLLPALSIRLGGAVREGDVAGAQARVLTLLATAGVAVHPWRRSGGVISASLRADYVLMNQTVTHASPAGADVSTRARTLSGVDVLLDTNWRLARGASFVAGGGVEEMLATTYVDLNGSRAATLSPLSGIAEAGFRLEF